MTVGTGVRFGVNEIGLINVYAQDIGNLQSWQQRKWAGRNVVPDGRVSKELLDSQMRAGPAETRSPEGDLRDAYNSINQEFERVSGFKLFRSHTLNDKLFLKCHRFRALDETGLFALAKDLARLLVESIDERALIPITPAPKGTGPGSIKHLEAALATKIDANDARSLTSVFTGIRELRLADAHLPSATLGNSMMLAGIKSSGIPLHQAKQMLDSLVGSLYTIAHTLEQNFDSAHPL